jgi:hypothetical protein
MTQHDTTHHATPHPTHLDDVNGVEDVTAGRGNLDLQHLALVLAGLGVRACGIEGVWDYIE